MRLIDADALEQELLAIRKRIADKAGADPTWFQTGACVGLETAGQCISKASKTDAEPVKHGKWEKVKCNNILDKAVFSRALKCSECGKCESRKRTAKFAVNKYKEAKELGNNDVLNFDNVIADFVDLQY